MRLAEHGGHTGPHRDGWGIANCEGPDLRFIKEAVAAADSDWVRFVRDHDLRSPIVVAHVRRATMGERSYRNTQPFARELAGRMHVFAHNGWLASIFKAPDFRPMRFVPVGESDSERAFCALLDRMAELWRPDETPSVEARLAIVSAFAETLRRLGPANFLYSDGDTLFGHGHRRLQSATSRVEPPGLVWLQRRCRIGEVAFTASGVSIEGAQQTVVLLASVPLTDEPWHSFEEGEVIAIRGGEIAGRRIPAEAQSCTSS